MKGKIEMKEQKYSGASLEKALKNDSLTESGAVLTGMAKPSDKGGYISFTRNGCDNWIDIPVDLIDEAEQIGQNGCRDHSHPVLRITLKKPKDDLKRNLKNILRCGK